MCVRVWPHPCVSLVNARTRVRRQFLWFVFVISLSFIVAGNETDDRDKYRARLCEEPNFEEDRGKKHSDF